MNYLSDVLDISGEELKNAKLAFEEIEKNTHLKVIDMSDTVFLSPVKMTGNQLICIPLHGEERIQYDEINDTFVIPSKPIKISGNWSLLDELLHQELPILCNGACFNTEKSGIRDSNQYLYYMGKTIYEKTLPLKLGFSGTQKGFVRNMACASICAGLYEDLTINFLYREKDGRKKIFGAFSESLSNDELLTLDDFIKACNSVGDEYKMRFWMINQRYRMAYVEFKTQPIDGLIPGITCVWSDTGFTSPYIQAAWRVSGDSGDRYSVQDEFEIINKEDIPKMIVDAQKLQEEASKKLISGEIPEVDYFNVNGYNLYLKNIKKKIEKEKISGIEMVKTLCGIMSSPEIKPITLSDPRAKIRLFAGQCLRK